MQRTIDKIVAYIVHLAEPDRVILFGSMSRGTNDVYSDIDLLIVSDERSQSKQIVEQVRQFAHELALRADVLVYSNQELDQACSNPYSFLSGVRREGRIVYQKE
jgi:predicted nucleotidyltransferase